MLYCRANPTHQLQMLSGNTLSLPTQNRSPTVYATSTSPPIYKPRQSQKLIKEKSLPFQMHVTVLFISPVNNFLFSHGPTHSFLFRGRCHVVNSTTHMNHPLITYISRCPCCPSKYLCVSYIYSSNMGKINKQKII